MTHFKNSIELYMQSFTESSPRACQLRNGCVTEADATFNCEGMVVINNLILHLSALCTPAWSKCLHQLIANTMDISMLTSQFTKGETGSKNVQNFRSCD